MDQIIDAINDVASKSPIRGSLVVATTAASLAVWAVASILLSIP